MKILVINGPNLALLGSREPEIYGELSLQEIIDHTEFSLIKLLNSKLDKIQLEWYQSDIEGELVSRIGKSHKENFEAIIINPAAYTHTSVAVLDALKICKFPVIEVHLSNTQSRDEIRKNKITTAAAEVVIEGAGKNAYLLGIMSLVLSKEKL